VTVLWQHRLDSHQGRHKCGRQPHDGAAARSNAGRRARRVSILIECYDLPTQTGPTSASRGRADGAGVVATRARLLAIIASTT
jgi:hypothetical protein